MNFFKNTKKLIKLIVFTCLVGAFFYLASLIMQYVANLGETLKLRNDAEILRQAARYHDFGKLYTKSFNDKKGHYVYYGHDKVSTYLYLCHIRKQNLIDELNRVRLCDRHYQTASLILNHMEWYRREDMTPIKELFNDDDLYYMLELLHEADLWGRNENAKEVTEW